MPNLALINAYLQEELLRRNKATVDAVEAAGWLDKANLLGDSISRPGKPLRELLRKGLIRGAVQDPPRPHGRWYINKLNN